MRIDAHTHLFPPVFCTEADRHGGIPWPGALPDADACLAAMDTYAIDASVVSLPLPLDFGGAVAPAQTATLARACNTHFADAVRESPTRIAALGCLPLDDIDAALDEIAFCYDELGLDGIVLPASHHGVYLGDDRFTPLLDELDRRGAYVFVHPVVGPDPLGLPFGPFLTELPFDTTRAVVNLLFKGTLSRNPQIRFQFAHLGGTALYLAPRIDEAVQRFPQLREAAPRGSEHLRDVFWDTGLSAGPAPLAAAIAAVGTDHVVFGTDWPFDTLRPTTGVDPAPGLDVLGSDRRVVEAAALALVPRLGANGG